MAVSNKWKGYSSSQMWAEKTYFRYNTHLQSIYQLQIYAYKVSLSATVFIIGAWSQHFCPCAPLHLPRHYITKVQGKMSAKIPEFRDYEHGNYLLY